MIRVAGELSLSWIFRLFKYLWCLAINLDYKLLTLGQFCSCPLASGGGFKY